MAQWLDHGALQSLLPTVQIQTLLKAYFRRNIIFHPFKRWKIVSMFVYLGKAIYPQILHLPQV